MSGGEFDYAYARVASFSEDLEDRLRRSDFETEYGEHPYKFEDPKVVEALEGITQFSSILSQMMKAAEWLYSGDMGEESFLQEMEKIMNGLEFK